jgi:hypothetical protein
VDDGQPLGARFGAVSPSSISGVVFLAGIAIGGWQHDAVIARVGSFLRWHCSTQAPASAACRPSPMR